MKFSQAVRGKRAEKLVEVPGLRTPAGEPVRCAMRPLTGAEESAVAEGARAHAASKGNPNAGSGNELYNIGRMAHTLAIGCLDPESPIERREPFFDGGAAQVLAELHIEAITFLWEHFELWQDECSPFEYKLTDEQLFARAQEVAAPGGETSFISMSPSMRWLFTHSMARLLSSSLAHKSSSGSPSESAPTTETKPEPQAETPPPQVGES